MSASEGTARTSQRLRKKQEARALLSSTSSLDPNPNGLPSGSPQTPTPGLSRSSSPTPTPGPSREPPKRKKTKAEINKAYRQRMKENSPESYAKYLENQRALCKVYREKVKADPVKLAHSNALAQVRNSECRKRKKEQKAEQPAKVKTRRDSEEDVERRNRECLYRREYRKKLSHQKKAAINLKRRQKRANEKLLLQEELHRKEEARIQKINRDTEAVDCGETVDIDGVKRSGAQRQLYSKIKRHMPKNDLRFVITVEQLIEKASPRKRAIISKRRDPMETIEHKIGLRTLQVIRRLKSKSDKTSRETRRMLSSILEKYGSGRGKAKLLNMHRRTLQIQKTPKSQCQEGKNREDQEGGWGIF